MHIKELQKEQQVQLANGWLAVLKGKPGNKTTVLAEVFGLYTEVGSVYCHDIESARLDDDTWTPVEHTPTQLKLKETVSSLDW